MNRILALLLVINFNFAQSQILNDSTRPVNCYHDGAIFLEIFSASQIIDWYINDDSLGLILIDANTPNIQLTTNKDSLVTSQCGSYVVQVDANFYYYYIGCPLGSRGSQLNVQCNGDSTGFLKELLILEALLITMNGSITIFFFLQEILTQFFKIYLLDHIKFYLQILLDVLIQY